MMSDRKLYKLGDLSKRITKGTTPTTLGLNFTNSGINFIKAEAFDYDGRIEKSSFEYIDAATHEKLKRSQLEKDDILFSMAGVYLGKTAIVSEDILPANTNQALGIIRLDKAKANPKYISYYLKQKSIIELVNNYSGQSAQPNINLAEIASIEILLPSLAQQQAIAEVLSSLDDKIDLLQSQNRTLEALAETLFRQWFIIEVEDGWEAKTVGDVCKVITKGTTPTTLGHQFTATGVNFIKAESLTDDGELLDSKFSHISKETHLALTRSIIEHNDLLLTIAGTIGRVAIVPERVLPANTNQAVAILRPKDIVSGGFLYCLFRSNNIRNDFEGRIVHAVQPNLSLGEIANITFRLPPLDKLAERQTILENLFQKRESNHLQIHSLANLRNALLPKMMNGKVEVSLT